MLGDKYRVISHGGLFAIVGGVSGGEAFDNKLAGMGADCVEAVLLNVGKFFFSELETAAESGFGEGGKEFIQFSHL
jgi:hypothetical protein